MRSLRLAIAASAVAFGTLDAPLGASETDTRTVKVSMEVATRTSLKVSAQLLQFEVTGPGAEAIASVDFSAGARTRQTQEVVLTVEPVNAIEGPGGAADVDTVLRFSGEGDATLAGPVHPAAPTVTGRWQGSGLRTGRIWFALRSAVAGSYRVPVRFVLSTP
jgi:hypothetical protein